MRQTKESQTSQQDFSRRVRPDFNLFQSHSPNQSRLISEALRPVGENLATLNQCLTSWLPADSTTSKQIIEHLFSTDGKRIRPALFFLAARMVKYDGNHLLPIAAVCEFVHSASLLHDDVVDNSTLRRNKPTAHTIWGDESAILVGDLIYARASEMMAETGSLAIVAGFAQAIRKMSEGELLQLQHIFNPQTTIQDYLNIVECKTATLIAMTCRAAGLLAGLSEHLCEQLAIFGKSVGMAFQLVDDALDYLREPEELGKPTLNDLREGKLTLPILMIKDKASASDLARLNSAIQSQPLSDQSITEICHLIHKYDTLEATLQRASSFSEQAKHALHHFEACSAREELETLVDRLVWRTN